jgi:proline iminopeptidase
VSKGTFRRQGFIDVGDGRVWYESAGTGSRTLLLLHGGPGGNCEDLEPFLDLAELGFRVVRYDQLGSWRSDQPDNPVLWKVPRFVREVEQVRRALDLGRMHLLGQSWGAFLTLEYALHFPEHLRSIVIASGAASTRECVAGMNAWKRELSVEAQDVLALCNANQEYDNPAYVAAMDELYRRNFCRVWPYPDPLARAMEHMAPQVYNTMWGPNEFTCTGSLIDWDRSDRLHEISLPTLITVGEFDEVHPSCARTLHAGITDSRLVEFAGCGHAVPLEAPQQYRSTLLEFLNWVDGVTTTGINSRP